MKIIFFEFSKFSLNNCISRPLIEKQINISKNFSFLPDLFLIIIWLKIYSKDIF